MRVTIFWPFIFVGVCIFFSGCTGPKVEYISPEYTNLTVYSTCFKDGIDGVDGLDGVFNMAISPDNKNVYVTGLLDDALAVFDRDTSTGALTFVTCFKDGAGGVDGLEGSRGGAVSPDNKSVYVTGFNENALAVFNIYKVIE